MGLYAWLRVVSRTRGVAVQTGLCAVCMCVCVLLVLSLLVCSGDKRCVFYRRLALRTTKPIPQRLNLPADIQVELPGMRLV